MLLLAWVFSNVWASVGFIMVVIGAQSFVLNEAHGSRSILVGTILFTLSFLFSGVILYWFSQIYDIHMGEAEKDAVAKANREFNEPNR
jgi:hypothetical protein